MGLNKLKWWLVRHLLSLRERHLIYGLGEAYFDRAYKEYIEEKEFGYPSEKAKETSSIMRGVEGSESFRNWKPKQQ